MKKKKSNVGENIFCKFCESPDAWISLEERRLMVNCPSCVQTYHLKEQHNNIHKQTMTKYENKLL